MEISYTVPQLLMFLLIYSFFGWAMEVLLYAIRDRQFVNRGILNVSFSLPCGVTAVILVMVLPTLNGQLGLQYCQCLIVSWAVRRISEHFERRIRREQKVEAERSPREKWKERIVLAASAGAYLVVYLLIHPMLFGVLLMPGWLQKTIVTAWLMILTVDFACVVYTLRTSNPSQRAQQDLDHTSRLANRMRNSIRRRLEKNYPGILDDQNREKRYVFAEGMCADKLIWVFLVSSFLGALIEMIYCRAMGDSWMNRSSLLYGNFSVVWGLGAVILTITLQRFADKPDRHVFMAGFAVGGAYEYLCSVFTELVFGTVFWDYSWMPLNIGGRTNVVYCIFWGILAVLWVKVLYPPMSRNIEKIPTLPGKIVTWALVIVLLCDGILTMGAMVRYTDRRENPEPEHFVDEFFDSRYDDPWMENRWPNMKIMEE